MAELRKDVDALKGSMDTVVNSVTELTNSVESRMAQALEKIKRMMLNNGGNPVQNGPAVDRSEERIEPRAPRPVENPNPNKNYQVDAAISMFDGTGLKD